MSNQPKGGRRADTFILEHFTREGEFNPKTKRWHVRCNYCPTSSPLIEHRDARCLQHIHKPENCPNAPEDVRGVARTLLMKKGGIESVIEIDSDTDQEEPSTKKAKLSGETATKKAPAIARTTSMDSYLDRGMTQADENKANVRLLRFLVHANIAFQSVENPFFLKWVHTIRPSYKPPSRYVLMQRYLPAEESRVFLEDTQRLEGRRNLTYLVDGWEDAMRRSVYGCILAEVGEHPVVLGLEELTGMRATADNIAHLSDKALQMKCVDKQQVIAVCTDNPTTMQAFRRKWTSTDTNLHVIPLACFMHGINTIIGKIVAFPAMKAVVTKNTRIVSFFQSSHYWGGQLETIATEKKVTRKLKTNTESRFYALILQALSVRDHKQALTELCMRENAQRSMGGLTPVAADVVATVFDMSRWSLTDQLIRVCKPLVDIIGNIESREANLADCMLQLIWAHREVNRLLLQDGDSFEFIQHARQVLRTQFHAMNTDIHWLTLFLHPLCRKLAISSAIHSRKLEDAYRIALGIVLRWRWSENQARLLTENLKAYYYGHGAFAGGKADAKDWWKSLVVTATTHPLKALAIKLFSIVPHAAEVERFFSNLGGIQSVKRSRLTLAHMQTLGTLRNHYTRLLHEEALKMGKSTRRKHSHMHTLNQPGIDVQRVDELVNNYLWVQSDTSLLVSDEDLAGPESVSMDEIDAEFDRLGTQSDTPEDGDGHDATVSLEEVYDIHYLDDISSGKVSVPVEEELDMGKGVLIPEKKTWGRIFYFEPNPWTN